MKEPLVLSNVVVPGRSDLPCSVEMEDGAAGSFLVLAMGIGAVGGLMMLTTITPMLACLLCTWGSLIRRCPGCLYASQEAEPGAQT